MSTEMKLALAALVVYGALAALLGFADRNRGLK